LAISATAGLLVACEMLTSPN